MMRASEVPMRIRDAVSAVFAFQDKMFIIRRQPYLKAFPGYHAFPGGKVDRDESEQPYELPYLKDHPARLMRALCREMMEELGYDLEKAIEQGEILGISELSTATTPPFHTHRFATRFYRIELSREVPLQAHTDEAEYAGWEACSSLLDQFNEGRLLGVPPLLTMIRALGKNPRLTHIPDIDLRYDEQNEVPWFEALRGIIQIPVRSNTLPPADRTNALIIGDHLVDPSPCSSEERDRMITVLKRFHLKGIFLTHHHGDHNEYADDLARTFGIPIRLSTDTWQRLQVKKPASYWQDVMVETVKDGDVLTEWLEQPVRIHAVPGHDEGQLGLAPDSMAWFLVGDLIQGIGTVVIAPPEGNMKKYFASLEKVIDLDPTFIIPSHGIIMGSTHRLVETLKHRKQREAQVLELHQQGKTDMQMLDTIYVGLDARLKPLALCNITAHKQKLSEEGRI